MAYTVSFARDCDEALLERDVWTNKYVNGAEKRREELERKSRVSEDEIEQLTREAIDGFEALAAAVKSRHCNFEDYFCDFVSDNDGAEDLSTSTDFVRQCILFCRTWKSFAIRFGQVLARRLEPESHARYHRFVELAASAADLKATPSRLKQGLTRALCESAAEINEAPLGKEYLLKLSAAGAAKKRADDKDLCVRFVSPALAADGRRAACENAHQVVTFQRAVPVWVTDTAEMWLAEERGDDAVKVKFGTAARRIAKVFRTVLQSHRRHTFQQLNARLHAVLSDASSYDAIAKKVAGAIPLDVDDKFVPPIFAHALVEASSARDDSSRYFAYSAEKEALLIQAVFRLGYELFISDPQSRTRFWLREEAATAQARELLADVVRASLTARDPALPAKWCSEFLAWFSPAPAK